MKKETLERKKKQQKIKEELNELKKESKLSFAKMTTQEQNDILLNLAKKKEVVEEEIVDSSSKKESKRTFTCKCGYEVTLFGDVDKSKNKCSKCSL